MSAHEPNDPEDRRGHSDRPGHGHAHAHDKGVLGALRYLRLLPVMWRSEVGDEVVRLIAPKIGERVVDLGAGMGAATMEAARTGAAVVAVDPTPFMRGILELRRWSHPGRSRVAVMEGAAESIPLADGSVDALWTINTIHHWTERTRASRELARVMRPGGRVLLVDEDFGNPIHPWHDEIQARRARRRHHGFDDVDVEALAAILTTAGFADVHASHATVAHRPARVIRATR